MGQVGNGPSWRRRFGEPRPCRLVLDVARPPRRVVVELGHVGGPPLPDPVSRTLRSPCRAPFSRHTGDRCPIGSSSFTAPDGSTFSGRTRRHAGSRRARVRVLSGRVSFRDVSGRATPVRAGVAGRAQVLRTGVLNRRVCAARAAEHLRTLPRPGGAGQLRPGPASRYPRCGGSPRTRSGVAGRSSSGPCSGSRRDRGRVIEDVSPTDDDLDGFDVGAYRASFAWRSRARCRAVGPALFFSGRGDDLAVRVREANLCGL